MRIRDSSDLRTLLDGVFSSGFKKNSDIPNFDIDYQTALNKTFQSEFYTRSQILSEEILSTNDICYQIIPSVSAVNNYIGRCWSRIHNKAILITDDESFDFASEIFSDFINKKPIKLVNISKEFSHKNIENIIETSKANSNVKFIVALGGGRVMDIQKFIGYKTDISMIAFPTSLASHVYASPKIHALPAIKKFGYDLTIDGNPPHLAIIDLYLLQKLFKSNPRLIYAGLGDISAFFTAKSDWILSNQKYENNRNYFVEVLIDEVIQWLDTFPIDNDFLDWSNQYHLCQVLLCNITDWEGSPPASGSEHLFALSIEKYAKDEVPLHGELVALGVIIMSLIQGNDYKFISRIIKRMKLPMNLSEIGVDKSMIISALNDSLEKGLKKDRYTILNEINQIKMETIFENTLNQLVSEKILTY